METLVSQEMQDFENDERPHIVIIGGGPGGIFSAWALEDKLGDKVRITIVEASNRLGGKLSTGEFTGVGAYEEGVAEIYGYSRLGADPLFDLITDELGLETKLIDGKACIVDGAVIPAPALLAQVFGEETAQAVNSFYETCEKAMSLDEYYGASIAVDNAHPWKYLSGLELLAREVKDPMAQHYLRTMVHSDLAAPLHQTNGLTLLKNVLMDLDEYMQVYVVKGGNAQIAEHLEEELDATVLLDAPVTAVEMTRNGKFEVSSVVNGTNIKIHCDKVVAALPITALSTITWKSTTMRRALDLHVSHFDRPGHYLRATFLFERPFWRAHIDGHWWMLDAFDGCCVYDEGLKNDYAAYGALSFLIAGNAALALANCSDDEIEYRCLSALPWGLEEAKSGLLERRVNRWMASVSAIPGGTNARARQTNHQPDRVNVPGFFVVGDYLFDATINGVMDSADSASDLILAQVLAKQFPEAVLHASPQTASRKTLALPVPALCDIMRLGWRGCETWRILLCGSGHPEAAKEMRALGFDVELYEAAAAQAKNGKLPYANASFDVVVDTDLCKFSGRSTDKLASEYRRVSKHGLILASLSLDMKYATLADAELLAPVKTLDSRWSWAERLEPFGFKHVLARKELLDAAFAVSREHGPTAMLWYEDRAAIFYSFYAIDDEHADYDSAASQRPSAAHENGKLQLAG